MSELHAALPPLPSVASTSSGGSIDDCIQEWTARLQRLYRYTDALRDKGISQLIDELNAVKDAQHSLHDALFAAFSRFLNFYISRDAGVRF